MLLLCRHAGRHGQLVRTVADVVLSTWRTDVHAGSISTSPVHDDVSSRSRSSRRRRGRGVRATAGRLPVPRAVGGVLGRSGRRRRSEPAACRRDPRPSRQPRTHAGRQRRVTADLATADCLARRSSKCQNVGAGSDTDSLGSGPGLPDFKVPQTFLKLPPNFWAQMATDCTIFYS